MSLQQSIVILNWRTKVGLRLVLLGLNLTRKVDFIIIPLVCSESKIPPNIGLKILKSDRMLRWWWSVIICETEEQQPVNSCCPTSRRVQEQILFLRFGRIFNLKACACLNILFQLTPISHALFLGWMKAESRNDHVCTPGQPTYNRSSNSSEQQQSPLLSSLAGSLPSQYVSGCLAAAAIVT